MTNVTEKDFRGKDIFCPIDLHEKSMLVGVAMDRGDLKFHDLDTDRHGGVAFLVKLLNGLVSSRPGSRVWVAYEASGCGFGLADVLEGEGFDVSVLAPSNLPVTVRSRSNKTDKRDVIRILEVLRGHVLAGNGLPSVWKPPAQVRDDREIVRRRLALGEKLAEVKNSILGLLRRYGLKKPESVKSNWTNKHLRWIRGLDTALEPMAAETLRSLLREFDFFDGELVRVEQEVIALSESERYLPQSDALQEIPGVGLLAAMVYLTELGLLDRFHNRRQIGSFLGLAPRSWESGERDDRKGHVSKLGPSRVRKILNQSAWSLVRHSPKWRKWFEERTPGGKGKKKMIVAVMRRLGIIMWRTALEAQ